MSAQTSNMRGGDSVKDRPIDSDERKHSLRAMTFDPAQSNVSTRFAVMEAVAVIEGLTFPSPCSVGHRRSWRICAGGRRNNARTQADADAGVNHVRWLQREGQTQGQQRAHALRTCNRSHPNESPHASPRSGDSLSIHRVPEATPDRGQTAPANTGMHAHSSRRRR